MHEENEVYTLFNDEITVWLDGGIHIKTRNKYNDPVELADFEAIELANLLIKLAEK